MSAMVEATKTLADYFYDWYSNIFRFGYGSGEPYIVPALKAFFMRCPIDGNYDYRVFEDGLTPLVAWLFIDVLCKADIIEYGTSPRFGWLSEKGRRLKAFIDSKSAEDLLGLMGRDEDYPLCYPDACNCGPGGYEEGRVCANPFWTT